MFDGVVCFYFGFIYDVFIQIHGKNKKKKPKQLCQTLHRCNRGHHKTEFTTINFLSKTETTHPIPPYPRTYGT